jgi:hypothetical protein
MESVAEGKVLLSMKVFVGGLLSFVFVGTFVIVLVL